MEQLLCHLVGDYCLQSDWMANEKTKKSIAALAHVVLYTLPFLFLTQVWWQLLLIAGTHFVIDRWRLARFVCWAKNFMAPPHTCGCARFWCRGEKDKAGTDWWYPWSECSGTGYHESRPAWLAVWLLIITDNTMHLICNYFILGW